MSFTTVIRPRPRTSIAGAKRVPAFAPVRTGARKTFHLKTTESST